jgi:EAL domain-containing protein (putative c-di-GMP-specific phosphodiesterase class I)
MIDLAHALDVGVVAEGVETGDELVWLVALGCDLAQGYLFSPAVDSHDAFELFGRTHDLPAGAPES